MSWLYVALLTIPFLSIISRVIYVQSNKNAYQSYSGQNVGGVENELISPSANMFNIGDDYTYINELIPSNSTSNRLEIIPTDNKFKLDNATYNDVSKLVWYKEGNSTNYFYYIDTTNHYTNLNLNIVSISFNVASYSFQNNDFTTPILNYFYKVVYNNDFYLDNVFTYSVNEIIKENNFGEIDFFQWFTDMFLNDNQTNNMYVGFANWYFNYILMVSCGYLLFLVLMWFINYSRRLLERGMNYDW